MTLDCRPKRKRAADRARLETVMQHQLYDDDLHRNNEHQTFSSNNTFKPARSSSLANGDHTNQH
jgi:hypothetical protein